MIKLLCFLVHIKNLHLQRTNQMVSETPYWESIKFITKDFCITKLYISYNYWYYQWNLWTFFGCVEVHGPDRKSNLFFIIVNSTAILSLRDWR